MNRKLGQMLLNEDLISIDQLNEALDYHKKNNVRIGTALLDLGYISDEVLSEYLSLQNKLKKN